MALLMDTSEPMFNGDGLTAFDDIFKELWISSLTHTKHALQLWLCEELAEYAIAVLVDKNIDQASEEWGDVLGCVLLLHCKEFTSMTSAYVSFGLMYPEENIDLSSIPLVLKKLRKENKLATVTMLTLIFNVFIINGDTIAAVLRRFALKHAKREAQRNEEN